MPPSPSRWRRSCPSLPPCCRCCSPQSAIRPSPSRLSGKSRKPLEALLTWLLALTEEQPVLFIVEDLHWIDPSTLEFLTLLVDQGPTAALDPADLSAGVSAAGLAHASDPLALQRLPQAQVEEMIARVTGGRACPRGRRPDRRETDGVPLFVEERPRRSWNRGRAKPRGTTN